MSFVTDYYANWVRYQRAAEQASVLVASILEESDLHADVIASRAKSPQSLRVKVFEGGYKNPRQQISDLVGVRVITHYRDEVDPFKRALKGRLRIDEKRSPDKRVKLKPTEFGYRSVHLVAKLTDWDATKEEYRDLRDLWFEIQIRSLVEHAWAAVEHEVQYKAKIEYPREPKRQFAALAGTLELVDTQFELLRAVRDDLIREYATNYRNGEHLSKELDTARLVALLSATLPGPGWMLDQTGQRPLNFKFAPTALAALSAAGIRRGSILARALRHKKARSAMRSYARFRGERLDDLTHLATICLLVATRRRRIFTEYFPEFAVDPVFRKALRY
jgi:ppGpp synthetase/RelA/SpoT-type nucleotidyltranferase